MTVSDLIAKLEKLSGSLPVEIATQKSWPLAHEIETINEATTDDGDTVVYLGAAEPHGYAAPDAY